MSKPKEVKTMTINIGVFPIKNSFRRYSNNCKINLKSWKKN